jgi:ATP-dependent Lhr-like helicase
MSVFKLLADQVRGAAEEFNVLEPTRPQEVAIPRILANENVLLIAPTGTGKTEAALLPVFSSFLTREQATGIKIIYIAPLRALNRDMLNRFERWGKRLGIKISVRHGDTPPRERQRQTRDPPDMLITTPETLQAILTGKVISGHLKSVRWLVVDEVHELAEDKRGVQLTSGLERLVELAGEFQRIGLSATVGSPAEVAAFLVGVGRNVEVLDVSGEKKMEVMVESPMPTAEDAELAEKILVDPTMMARLRRLRELIEKHGSVLSFVNTREAAETIGSRLRLWDPSLSVAVHHGSLARDARVEAEKNFRDGKLKSLICTSSMELGIDIGRVSLVVQYSSPRQVVRLVQRVGRSGHGVGRISKGIVLAISPDDAAEAAVISRRAMAGQLESGNIHESALDVLAHQLVGFSIDRGWVDVAHAAAVFKRAYPFRNLTEAELENVLEQLDQQGIISRADGKFKARKSGFLYYFSNLSMIPDTRRYRIRDIASRKSIGVLDEEFVASYAQPDVTFVCRGETWKVVEVDHERDLILVEQFDDPLGAIPVWEGEMIPVPFEVAQDVGNMRRKIEEGLKSKEDLEKVTAELEKAYLLSKEAASWVVDEVADLSRAGVPVPTDRVVLLESCGEFVVLHTCFGSLVNQTLAWALAELLSARTGASVQVRSDPYRIAFRFPQKTKPDILRETLEKLLPEHLNSVLELTLKHSAMFQWRLMHVAKRFGAIRRDADLSKINVRRLVESFNGTPVFQEALRETMLEKMDVQRTIELLNSLRSGRLSLQVVEQFEPTVLAWPILNQLVGGELVVPRRAEREILLAVKSRLERQPVKLHCMNCNEWSVSTAVNRLPEKITCKKCGAGLITVLPRESKELLAAIKKHAREERLKTEEKRRVERAFQIADLILTGGKRAVVALSGRGVGPRAALKILSRDYRDSIDFYREILRAERTYAKTRRFWAG